VRFVALDTGSLVAFLGFAAWVYVGAHKRRVLADRADAEGCNEPSWSPDGTTIAFTRSHDNDVDGEIYTVNVDGTGLTQVTNAPGTGAPNWGTHPPTG
jgi:Tol biopolymer transport system component